ncbi:hypothetical protein Arub01_46210 [Actinomadura rubrobrunea]|uniref:Uncharacterized protein n=1 Tax=Actinomadura rubrobrunea TaxID=115335 RepID=A0A9W6UYL5_9ACTN|nr:hypothetical protein Arub01_46210 [Actinomadura rubrobrunea]
MSARLTETSAGIVYLGVDAEGRQASVAVLNRGAAGDAAARDRFRAAIEAAWPRSGVGAGAVGGAGRSDGEAEGEDAAPVVAAQPDGPTPWVATRYDADRPDRVGAERFLDSVLLRGAFQGRWNGRRRGPQFLPYWLGAREPAVASGPVRFVPVPVRSDRGLIAALLTLAAVLLLLGLLMVVLFACQPRVSAPPSPPPEPPSPSVSPPVVPPPLSPRPSPSPSSPSPSPSPSGPSSGPTDGGEGEDGGPV